MMQVDVVTCPANTLNDVDLLDIECKGYSCMPKRVPIALTATPEEKTDIPRTVTSRALAQSKSYALEGLPERRAIRTKPSVWQRWGLWLGLAAAAGMGGWLLYAQPWHTGLVPVGIEVVAPGPIMRVLAVNGRVAALRSVAVKSTVAGSLVAPLAEEGDVVAKGKVLARLDETSQQAAVRQAVAAFDQAVGAQTQARDALARAKTLGSNVSRVAVDDARWAMERADQEVGRLGALVDQAHFQLTKFSIVAPIAGTILTRGVEPGQVIDLSTALFTLADLRELVVEADVDESYATQIKPGMPALLQLTGDQRTLDGTVSFVAPVVDAATGGLAVKIAFNQPQAVPVGLTVTANIIVDQRTSAISAPRTAIVTAGSAHSLFVLADAKAKLIPVNVIDWPADRLIVTEGLKAGDRLVVDAHGLVDGQGVTVAGE